MRASLALILLFAVLGLILWTTLGGALFVVSVLFWLILVLISVGYADTGVLFFLGAREVSSADEPMFFQASAQEAYKLALPKPNLYFYDGTFERGFLLHNQQTLSLVLSRSLLHRAQSHELSAICFELLLQAKKGAAVKRTRIMFLLGLISWVGHSLVSLLSFLIPIPEVRKVLCLLLNIFLHPAQELIFRLLLGQGHFRKIESDLKLFNSENLEFNRVALKLRRPEELYSIPSKKTFILSSLGKNSQFQTILSIEMLPHEWDKFQKVGELKRV
jgi:hypothetical protein